jgi:hypothetical protein
MPLLALLNFDADGSMGIVDQLPNRSFVAKWRPVFLLRLIDWLIALAGERS